MSWPAIAAITAVAAAVAWWLTLADSARLPRRTRAVNFLTAAFLACCLLASFPMSCSKVQDAWKLATDEDPIQTDHPMTRSGGGRY